VAAYSLQDQPIIEELLRGMTDIITTADKLACAKRELAMRKAAYPRWVEQKKLSAGKAAHELACMEAIVEDYEWQVAGERQE
jgi:hypothetical protein